MTLPKGFKQKDTKKAKIEDSKSSKENNNKNVNGDSDQIKVTRATTDDFINKQENKIVAENISPKEQVNIDDISVDDGTATVSTVTTTPTPEGEVLSETELKVPMQEREKEVLSETELKVMSAADSSLENEGVSSYSSRSVQNDVNNAASTTTTTATTTSSSNASQVQRDQQHSVNRALDETKNNIRRATDEARKDIPRYTQAANEYQEQTIQTAREIADNFLESQKEIINSLQSAWLPQIDAANRVFVSSWLSPTRIIELYSKIISNFVHNAIIATRLVNNTVFANMEAFNATMSQAKSNSQDMSKIGINISKTFSQTLNSANNSNDTKRGDPSQIPKGEDVPAEVQKVVSEEAGVEGQRKEVNVESYSKVASLGQVLKDLDFPTNKVKILEFVKMRNANGDILSSLQRIKDKQYHNVSEVAKAAGLVY
jgi:vacuolar-type H+-ATPase subunit H